MLSVIIAILGGLIAASSLIVSKKPNAQELLDKITPYQGFIGVALVVYSIITLLSSLSPFSLIGIAIAVVEFIVGFLLGYSLISKYLLEKNEAAKEKGQELRQKLVKFQVPAGVTLTILGVIGLLFYLRIF